MNQWIMVLLLTVSFVLTGCTGGDESEEDDETPSTADEAVDATWTYDTKTKILSDKSRSFKVSFPAKPTKSLSGGGMEVYSWSGDGVGIVLSTWPRKIDTPDSVMSESCDNAVKRDNLTEVSRTAKTLPGGFRGFDLAGTADAKTADGKPVAKPAFKMQQYFNENTKFCFFLYARATPEKIDGPEVQEFFKTFSAIK